MKWFKRMIRSMKDQVKWCDFGCNGYPNMEICFHNSKVYVTERDKERITCFPISFP